MENEQLKQIVSHFETVGTVDRILPLGNGLINDTYRVVTQNQDTPDYVLQRINDAIFTDVDLLLHLCHQLPQPVIQQARVINNNVPLAFI
ncbi:MAG: hypothetical protein KHX29_10820, partial [Prevotella buccalis]|nr:hypothetical protein [Hoylesella buccalis]